MKQHKRFSLFRRQNSSVKLFLDYEMATKKQMHYDVTLHDVTAIINQIYTAYRNSLLSPSGFYMFQVRSVRSDS